jgi:hypothetical protein
LEQFVGSISYSIVAAGRFSIIPCQEDGSLTNVFIDGNEVRPILTLLRALVEPSTSAIGEYSMHKNKYSVGFPVIGIPHIVCILSREAQGRSRSRW